MDKPTIYIVATPIGNLEDLSSRAVRILGEVDSILAEDTRVARILLSASQIIRRKIETLQEHTTDKKLKAYIERIKNNETFALTSDAGTPGISDPGAYFLDKLYASVPNLDVVPIPGPSAITAALSVSGFYADRFMFLGFPPHKKGRTAFFNEVANSKDTVVFFESTHRIEKTLQALENVLSSDQRILVGRELTKKFETITRGIVSEVTKQVRSDSMRGEFVIIVEKKSKKRK